MSERLGVPAFVLESLAHGKIEVIAVLLGQIGARQMRLHRQFFLGAEAKGLQVGEAPIGLAQVRRQLNAPAVGRDAVLLPAGGGQRMPVAQPNVGMFGMRLQYFRVYVDGFAVLADLDQNDRLQISIHRIVRIQLLQPIDLSKRGCGFIAPMQNHGVLVARRIEARRQLQTSLQECLGVGVAAQTGRHLGQHAQRGHIGRVLLQMRAQQGFGLRNSCPRPAPARDSAAADPGSRP